MAVRQLDIGNNQVGTGTRDQRSSLLQRGRNRQATISMGLERTIDQGGMTRIVFDE